MKIVHRGHQAAADLRHAQAAEVVDSVVRVPVAADLAAEARAVVAASAARVPVAVDSVVHQRDQGVETEARTSVHQRHRSGCAVRRQRNRNISLADPSRNAPAGASTPWTISRTTHPLKSMMSRPRRTRASTIRMRNNRT